MGPDQGAEGGGTPPPQALNLGVPCLLTKQETCLLTLALLLMDSEGYQSLTARPQCSHLWNRSWGQGPRGTALGRPSRVGFFCSTWALASAGPSSHLAVPAVPRGGATCWGCPSPWLRQTDWGQTGGGGDVARLWVKGESTASRTSQKFRYWPWTLVCPAVGHRGQNHEEFWKPLCWSGNHVCCAGRLRHSETHR